MKWTTEKPTEQGWYWYRDEFYSSAPVCLVWTGFINRPEARALWFDICCGDECDWPDGDIKDSNGEWAGPIEEPEDDLL